LGATSVSEWRQYRALLADEKELDAFLNTDMPTDPILLARLSETAEQLKLVIAMVDQYSAQLDQVIK